MGYLTGMGRDLMEQLGYDVDAIYYLPNLRLRFVESTLYPFIGGDTVRRSEALPGGLQPAVNRILPYTAPEYTGMDDETAWELSLCCLENARDILLALETNSVPSTPATSPSAVSAKRSSCPSVPTRAAA